MSLVVAPSSTSKLGVPHSPGFAAGADPPSAALLSQFAMMLGGNDEGNE